MNHLAECPGQWQGTSTICFPDRNTPQSPASALTVTPVPGGRFIRLDYTWAQGGASQQGSRRCRPANYASSTNIWPGDEREALAVDAEYLRIRGSRP